MKANEFFKKVGIDAVRSYLAAYEDDLTDDLKRLIESHELVEQHNGLFEAKELIRVSPKMTSELRELAATIADVESCQ